MSKMKDDPTAQWPDDIKQDDPRYGDAMAAMMSGGGNPAWTRHYGRSPTNQDAQQELARLRTDLAYLKLRDRHLYEFRRANREWITAKPDEIPALQARAQALLEVLELPNVLYHEVGGEGTVFDPVVRTFRIGETD